MENFGHAAEHDEAGALEAIVISQQRGSLVNGCSGDALFTFVT